MDATTFERHYPSVAGRFRTIVALMAMVGLGACYQYVPLRPEAPLPDPGAEVRFRLTSPTELQFGATTVHDASRIEGVVYQTNADTIGVFSRWIRSAYGGRYAAEGAVVFFPMDSIGLLEQRKLVPAKTALAVGSAVAGLAIVITTAVNGGGGGPVGPPGGGTEARLATGPFTIRIPIP
ncbi:MAG: hypothetical protein ACE5HT_06400 [Gemmatimonadales bacterium]